MSQWVRAGLRRGVQTTGYPDRPEAAAGVSPGFPAAGRYPAVEADALVSCCPTGALTREAEGIAVDQGRCVHCYRCARGLEVPLVWRPGYEWAGSPREGRFEPLEPAFRRSVSIIVVDAGDCGACLHEVKQLNNPYYNMHRLGFFLTPSPRHADLLIVVGSVTDHMRVPLEKTYQAMPDPKRVIAVGACALSGGLVGPSFVSEAGVGAVLPVDVVVPGHPPPPLAILHALLVAVGRRPPAPLRSPGPGHPGSEGER